MIVWENATYFLTLSRPPWHLCFQQISVPPQPLSQRKLIFRKTEMLKAAPCYIFLKILFCTSDSIWHSSLSKYEYGIVAFQMKGKKYLGEDSTFCLPKQVHCLGFHAILKKEKADGGFLDNHSLTIWRLFTF